MNEMYLEMFQNNLKICSTVLPVSEVEHLRIFKNMCFICNDKSISDNNRYNEGGTGLCEMDCAKQPQIEHGKYFDCDKGNRFYETPCRLNILCNK